jgi:uncharacterized lipoprotein YddW (UPF0748 family)
MERCVPASASGLRIAFTVICLVIAAGHVMPAPVAARANAPLRAFWAARVALDSPDAVRRAIAAAVAGGFDTVMVPVTIGAEPPVGFDGAREMVKEARDRGLRAHAWVEVTIAAGPGELPASRDHVLYQHPEWLMVPRELAAELLKVDVRSPSYVGRLSRWVRTNGPRIDALHISPLAPEATGYLVNSVTAAVKRYSVDGVFLDAVRFPGVDFDYSRQAMEIFRADTRAQLPADERARLDKVESIDPFAYAEEFPDRWRQFRQSRLTNLLSRLRKAVAAVGATLVVSAGIAPDPDSALADSFQDWTNWMETGLVDGVGRRSGAAGTIVFTVDGFADGSTDAPSSGTGSAR